MDAKRLFIKLFKNITITFDENATKMSGLPKYRCSLNTGEPICNQKVIELLKKYQDAIIDELMRGE